MKKTNVLLFILLLVLGLSCSNRKDITKEFIPSEKMVDILVDMYICDGIMSSTLIRKQHTVKDTFSNYQFIFQKHQFHRHEFDSAMAILIDNPKECAVLYEEVIARLTEIEGNLTDTIKLHHKLETK